MVVVNMRRNHRLGSNFKIELGSTGDKVTVPYFNFCQSEQEEMLIELLATRVFWITEHVNSNRHIIFMYDTGTVLMFWGRQAARIFFEKAKELLRHPNTREVPAIRFRVRSTQQCK